MLDQPEISVVVPTLNSAEYLPDTLASLAAQEGVDFEVIVIDGGSTDRTVEILREHQDLLPLRWQSEPDQGQADAINKGFRLARGEILSWLNSDDTLTPGALASVAGHFTADPELEMLSGLGVLANLRGDFLHIIPEAPIQRIEDLYRFGCHICQPSTFLRRRILERHGPLDVSFQLTMDFEYWLRIGRDVHFRFVPEVLSVFRLHPASKSVSQQGSFWAEEVRAFRQHGGTWRSPLYLAHYYHARVLWITYLLLKPLRWCLWPLFGLARHEWFRPGPPPVLAKQTDVGPIDRSRLDPNSSS